MGRFREFLAHGSMASLAVLFAIAFAAVELADAVSQVVIAAIEQHTVDPNGGGSGFDFRILSTNFDLVYVVQAAVVFLLVAALVWVVWRLTRTQTQECPECQSEVPAHARVCRYCTADLPASPA
jgi:large conductance mechanosensitive channel